jgi:hypothetical protein
MSEEVNNNMASNNEDVRRRFEHLEGRADITDTRLTSVMEDLASTKSTVESIRDLLSQMSNNRPNVMNVAIGVVAGVIGLVQYVDLRLQPVLNSTTVIEAEMDNIHGRELEAAERRGRWIQMVEAQGDHLLHMDELFHRTEERVAELREQVSAGKVSRQATGDYVKEHVNNPRYHHPEPVKIPDIQESPWADKDHR